MSIASQLSALEAAGLVRLAGTQPDLEYLFRHALVRDAAYASLLAQDRKRLHQAVGEALEEMYPERREELAPQLARHFFEAGDALRALRYFMMAGDSALAAFANQEAEGHYRCALDLDCPPAERARVLFGLGRALARQSCFAEAISTWQQAIAIYAALGDSDNTARLYALAARSAWHNGDACAGLAQAEEGLATVGSAPESIGLAALVHEAGRAYFFNHNLGQARRLCQHALEMAERLGAVDVQADALSTLGILPDQPPDAALDALIRAVDLAESAGLVGTAARAHFNLGGIVAGMNGDIKRARDHIARAAELARRQGVVAEEFMYVLVICHFSAALGDFAGMESHLAVLRQLAHVPLGAGWSWTSRDLVEILLQRYRGDPIGAAQRLESLAQQLRVLDDRRGLFSTLSHLGEVLIELERWHEAAMVVQEVVALSNTEIDRAAYNPYLLLSQIHTHYGQFAAAQHALTQARRLMTQSHERLGSIWLSHSEAMLAAAMGQWAAAFAAFELAAEQMARLGIRWWWARLLCDWANAHMQRGEPADLERARALLRKSQAIFEQIGAPGYVIQVQDMLERLSALIYAHALAHQTSAQELAMAGEIQAGLLPGSLPQVPGWQLAAVLDPARETAGDFYDCILLPNGCLGIVVADVADKGAGAALYMAMTRTLIRTYAREYPVEPEQVLSAVNRRMLQDTPADLFVTAFYAILDLASGVLTYCNAGHNPPIVLSSGADAVLQRLRGTGLALGVMDDAVWERRAIQLAPESALLLYTDGVTEAQNQQEELFGEERLIALLHAYRGCAAQDICEALIASVYEFTSDAPQFDDITVMVIVRTG